MGEINTKVPGEVKFSRTNILTNSMNYSARSRTTFEQNRTSNYKIKPASFDQNSLNYDSSTKNSSPSQERCLSDTILPNSTYLIKNKTINFDVKKIFRKNLNAIDPATQGTVTSYKTETTRQKRESQQIRNSYFAKLIYKNVLTSKKEKTHNTVFIFDWDDTILCTTFLSPNGTYNDNARISEQAKEKMKVTQDYAYNLLSLSIRKGYVYIITNSSPGWVEYSSRRYLPKIYSLLQKIKIISARGEYERIYPGDMRMWKIQAFTKIIDDLDVKLVTNLICVGDSLLEMEAGEHLANQFETAFIKTVKFREAPKIEELNKQLKLVNEEFNVIYSSAKNLTIKVERKQK